MRYRFHTADVFTDQRFGGNQLAVLPEADGLTPGQMQQIAREFNYSETVFILPPAHPSPDGQTFQLRIFTPDEELPFAGHPTIGAAFILTRLGRVRLVAGEGRITFEEGAGPVAVHLTARPGEPFQAMLTAPQRPQYGEAPPVDVLARLLGLEVDDLVPAEPPSAVSCGLPFLFIPVRTLAAIRRLTLNLELWRTTLAGTWAPLLAVFTRETESPEVDIHLRVFCPGLGVPEDPATGSAAAALGGYLARSGGDGTRRWVIEQGIEIGRPSRLVVEVDRHAGQISAVRVGGAAIEVMSGELEL